MIDKMKSECNFDSIKVSVIVPVYNVEAYLERCLNSLVKQTLEEIEIIVVNDGTKDNSQAIIDRYAAAYPQKVISLIKENGGLSDARNYGIPYAHGEYIGFVDSDDYVDADMYERLYGAIEKTGMPVAQVGRDEIDKDGNILPNICEPVATEQVIPAEGFLKELLMHRGDCSFCTKLLRKDLFTIEQFPVGALNEDFHLLVKMLTREESAVPGIACIPGQAYHVFYRPDSNTRDKNRFSRVFADNIDNADMVLALVDKKYPELSEIAFRFGIFQRLDYLLHIPIAQMTGDNAFYRRVVRDLRHGWWRAMKNPWLTKKNKCYHTLFAIAPKGIRVLHKKLKHIE